MRIRSRVSSTTSSSSPSPSALASSSCISRRLQSGREPVRRRCRGTPSGTCAARRPVAPARARRVHGTAQACGRGRGAAPRDRGGPRLVVDLLRPAGNGQDDARAHRGGRHAIALRGALGRLLGQGGRPGRDRAGPRSPRRERQAHRALHRRDPPLQQDAAGRAPAGRRVRPRDADRRHHREPLSLDHRRARLALPAVRVRGALRGRSAGRAGAGRGHPGRAAGRARRADRHCRNGRRRRAPRALDAGAGARACRVARRWRRQRGRRGGRGAAPAGAVRP